MTIFRPCIDLHEGAVKQVVGATLESDAVTENFVSDRPAAWFADFYRQHNLRGGHIIKLGPGNDPAARAALESWPGGLQLGGGLNNKNAGKWLEIGASHVIFTSYLFPEPAFEFSEDRLFDLCDEFGKGRIVVDLSCRRMGYNSPEWRIVSNRWKTVTKGKIEKHFLDRVSECCGEFLIHAAHVEGLRKGIDEELVQVLGQCFNGTPITYAGGANSVSDLEVVQQLTMGTVDVTLGSCLDIFGGDVKVEDCIRWNARR